jgi:transcriptional regulator with XRE-family HTH domain
MEMTVAIAMGEASHDPRRGVQDIDRHIGARMRERRIMLGLTQQQLADLIGVTYQQAHKYEKGINRLAAGRLYNLAQVLGVDVSYFFDGLHDSRTFRDTSHQRLLLELATHFINASPAHQRAIYALARALADASQRSSPRSAVES